MTAHVNVSGTFKEITEIHVNVSGVNKEVSEGWVNVSGTWKQFFSSGDVFIPEFDATLVGTGNSSYGLTMTINRNGTMTVTNTGGGLLGGTLPNALAWWTNQPDTDIGDDYEVRVTPTAGVFTSGTTGTYQALTLNRTWTRSVVGPTAFGSVTFTIDIKRVSTGAVVTTTGNSLSITVV